MTIYLWSLGLVVAAPLLFVLALKLFLPIPLVKAFVAIALIGVPFALALPWVALRFSVETTDGEVTLSGGLGYSATISSDAIAGAEILSSAAALGERRPVLRTNGIALPGLAVGRFQLANGSDGIFFVHDASAPVAVLRASRPPGALVVVNQSMLVHAP